jgi:malonate transporter and related proteins
VNFFQLLLPDFSLILCGYLLCRYSALDRRVWEQVDRLVYYFLFPVLLFYSIIRQPLDWPSASPLVAAGLSMAAAGIALAYSLPYWPWVGRRIERRLHAAGAQVGFRFNSFIALALIEKVAGPQGLPLLALLIGLLVPVFNIGAVLPMARHAGGRLLHELARNPLILGTASGLLANLAGLSLPELVVPTLTRIGNGALALGLMAAGAGMQLGAMRVGKTLSTALLSLKHLGLPLLALLMARLWRLDALSTQVLLMFAAVPTATSCYVLAARMGYNGAYVAGLVTASTMLGMLSLPLALGWLARL